MPVLYEEALPEQTVVSPSIEVGAPGAFLIATASDCVGDVPQLLFAVTVIFPLEESAVKIIESVVEVLAENRRLLWDY